MPEFPHLKDTVFPNVGNVDVYKYANNFDYRRYDTAQMHITLCSVPWDMGEAHVGNRTISGIGNVVYFGDEEKRDKWFADIPDDKCVRFTTKYKELHRDNEIMLPVPFDVACQYNYVMVQYEPFANADSLVQYETLDGLDKWFWFVREVEFVSPNTTRVHLLNDAFQTFIYRLNITGMMLERGHAPLFAVDAATYLANPLANNELLLSEDVNFGNEPSYVRSTASHVFNGLTYACIACTGNPLGTWGTKGDGTWKTPVANMYSINGVPSYYVFAVKPANLSTLIANLESDIPQFIQTIKGVFFAPSELLTIGDNFTFASVTCYKVSTAQKTIDFTTLSKAKFGYPARYADLAKLYTFPYSHIEVTDENGNVTVVRVEDTEGTLQINAALSLAFPAISLKAHLMGIGSSTLKTLTFTNITSKSLTTKGTWYRTLREWNIPVFGVMQIASKRNDYDTHFDRAQQKVAYDNEYASTRASAATERANTYRNAATQKANADEQAACITANASVQAAGNTAMTSAGNTQNYADAASNFLVNIASAAAANSYTNASTNNSVALTEAQAAASQASNAVNAGAAFGTAVATGNAAGAVSALASGIGSAVAVQMTTEAGVNYTTAQATASKDFNNTKRDQANSLVTNLSQHAGDAAIEKCTAANSVTTSTAANSAAMTSTVAANTKATMEDNADESRDTAYNNADRAKDTAQNAVTNSVKQAALKAPAEFGTFANTGNATTKPLALLANVVTQTASAIRQAGDTFLRYGYYLNQYWEFDGNWNIGKHFTYWKLSDFWVSGLNIPDMYVDKLRFFLYGGVTVWRKPEDIGRYTIYENMEV